MHNLALQQEDSWAHMQTLYRECLSVHPNRQSAKRSDPSMDDRFCYARLQQLGELCGGHGPAEEVALAFRAVVGPEESGRGRCVGVLRPPTAPAGTEGHHV